MLYICIVILSSLAIFFLEANANLEQFSSCTNKIFLNVITNHLFCGLTNIYVHCLYYLE